jgi:hypothetical protein
MLRKSADIFTTGINVAFYNTGTVDVQRGTISVNGSYALNDGTLNFAINSVTSFGRINFSGNAALTGTVSADFSNGYLPTSGNSFAVLTYDSETGIFANLNLPSSIAWEANYGPTAFSLNISNIPVTLCLNSTSLWTTNGFNLMLKAPIGSDYVVQASTNLVNWVTVTNFIITSWPFHFYDPAAAIYKQRFYRAVLLSQVQPQL